jgi:hypothetical protein
VVIGYGMAVSIAVTLFSPRNYMLTHADREGGTREDGYCRASTTSAMSSAHPLSGKIVDISGSLFTLSSLLSHV